MHNISNEFNKHFDSSAPDLLKKIQETPVVLINTEDKLFSEINKTETKEDNKILRRTFKWCSIAAAVAAIFICAIMFFPKSICPPQIAGNIIIDCNPSVNIEVTEDLKVNSFYAVNDDGAEILDKIDITDGIDGVVEQVVYHLKKDGYLNSKDNNILISYCYKNNSEKFNSIKKLIKTRLIDTKVEIIYQSFRNDISVAKKAERNKVSVGKYVYIQKVKPNKNIEKEKLYDMNINHIVECVKKDNPVTTAETSSSSNNNFQTETIVTKPNKVTDPTDNTQINNKATSAYKGEFNKGKNEAHQNENATYRPSVNINSNKPTDSTEKHTVSKPDKDKGNSNNSKPKPDKNEKPNTVPSQNKEKPDRKETKPSNPKANDGTEKNNGKPDNHKNTDKRNKNNPQKV